MTAIANGDKEAALKDYKRFYTEAETNLVKEQINRNKNTKDFIEATHLTWENVNI